MTEELEIFFRETHIPEQVKLSGYENITDTGKFIEGHILRIKTLKPKLAKPYLERLKRLQTLLNNK